jgi:hypothetical protein
LGDLATAGPDPHLMQQAMSVNSLPLLQHALESASAFTPERLMDAVRTERGLAVEAVPPLCVLDFDGELSDRLEARELRHR